MSCAHQFCLGMKSMEYIRVARELAGIVPAVRGLYSDLVWLVEVVRTWQPDTSGRPEVELVECFRECLPLEHDEPVWSTECEYDCEEWVHCSSERVGVQACDARPPRASSDTFPSLAELCAWSLPHAERSLPPCESTPGPSQAEVPQRVPKNTSGGSVVPAPGPPLSSP